MFAKACIEDMNEKVMSGETIPCPTACGGTLSDVFQSGIVNQYSILPGGAGYTTRTHCTRCGEVFHIVTPRPEKKDKKRW